MKLDFGRTADRIYINAKTTVAYAAGFLPKAGAKAGGIGYTEEASPTLMSQHRPAVVYGYTQSGYGEFKEGVGTLKKSRGGSRGRK